MSNQSLGYRTLAAGLPVARMARTPVQVAVAGASPAMAGRRVHQVRLARKILDTAPRDFWHNSAR